MNITKFLATVAMALSLLPSAGAQEIVDPRKVTDTLYRLGPYPIEIEYEGVKANLPTWLFLSVSVEGRGDPVYKLNLTLKTQLNPIAGMAVAVVRNKLSQDNCGRLNAVDNWVYGMNTPQLAMTSEHNLRIQATGSIETWSCFENPVFETVCDHYRDSLGLTWPYNCRTRRASPIKTRNLQQGYELTKDVGFDAGQGDLLVKDYKPVVNFTSGGAGPALLNTVALLQNNFGAIFSNAILSPQRIKMAVPTELRVLNPRYEVGRFESNDQGVPFLVAAASISISASQVDGFMRRTFGGSWPGIAQPGPSQAARLAWTKTRMRDFCSKEAPGMPVEECAARMGFPYVSLPE